MAEELKDEIKEFSLKIKRAIAGLKLEDKKNQLAQLKMQMAQPDFWQDQNLARDISLQASALEDKINTWKSLVERLHYLETLSVDKEANDLTVDLQKDLSQLQTDYENLSQQLWLQGKYDSSPAIVTINAGAGGVDAQDWAQMLERMYLRFAQQNQWSVNYLSRSAGSEAGIKSTTFEVRGEYAYGYLKNEAGVHRLVRLSPYDADHARHTSFAMVEVLPELTEVDIKIKDEDLKIETFRASGHGGQAVNKTDSAVRIIHLPTGLVASCQNERSQMQNKKQAMLYLQSKLQRYYEAEKDEEKKALKGEYTEAAWGNQIRSYVIHPYKLVKDHRTNYESSDPDKVLAGDLMPFIRSNLEKSVADNQ